LTVLYEFADGADGRWPGGGPLVRDAAGNLYGTNRGGTLGFGTVFELQPGGTLTVLHGFTGEGGGWTPTGGLVRDAAGSLYGTTVGGGSNKGAQGFGTVFEVSPTETFTVLHVFTAFAGGESPNAIVMDSAGNIYGTTVSGGTYGNGMVFKMTPWRLAHENHRRISLTLSAPHPIRFVRMGSSISPGYLYSFYNLVGVFSC
jgi:uncharacterized repeat protein (TIGR03803 family)